MKLLSAITLPAILFLAADAGPAQAAGQKAEPPLPTVQVETPPKRVPVDRGRLEGGTYSNDFFGFSINIPTGWVAQDASAKQAIAEAEADMSRVFYLFSASKYDLHAPGPDFNAHIMCVADRVPTAVLKTEAEYLAASLSALKEVTTKTELTRPIRTERVGGAAFGVMDVRVTNNQRSGVQRHYVKLVKGYALTLVYTYADEADLKTFEEVVKSLKFR